LAVVDLPGSKPRDLTARGPQEMNPRTITVDPVATKLRRVGRLARHRMRIDGDALRNGSHTDGTLTVEITGLGSPVAGAPDEFEWSADRPIALVIVRAGVDGDDVSFHVGPATAGVARPASASDGSGLRYVAFCYDAPIEAAGQPASAASPLTTLPAAPVASPAFAPTVRDRRSILSLLLGGTRRRSASGSPA
jgi:hypothetical protein